MWYFDAQSAQIFKVFGTLCDLKVTKNDLNLNDSYCLFLLRFKYLYFILLLFGILSFIKLTSSLKRKIYIKVFNRQPISLVFKIQKFKVIWMTYKIKIIDIKLSQVNDFNLKINWPIKSS